jgi:esterase/lipase
VTDHAVRSQIIERVVAIDAYRTAEDARLAEERARWIEAQRVAEKRRRKLERAAAKQRKAAEAEAASRRQLQLQLYEAERQRWAEGEAVIQKIADDFDKIRFATATVKITTDCVSPISSGDPLYSQYDSMHFRAGTLYVIPKLLAEFLVSTGFAEFP